MDSIDLSRNEVWFLTGNQFLYGNDALRQVASDAKAIVAALNRSKRICAKIVWKPTLTTQDGITETLLSANGDAHCIGVICWMHTFSPAKMWINGLKALQKPLLHLHTQANRDLPWRTIDMDFMNLNQSAHGDLEFGYICTRMGIRRKVVTGFYANPEVQRQIDVWCRVAAAWADSQHLKVARIGDNMRNVAVTEGDKVAAQIQFGYSVNGYGIADLIGAIDKVSPKAARKLVEEYRELYTIPDTSDSAMCSIMSAAIQELGIRAFLEEGGFHALTTTFEDLTGMDQLPGLACQRLMADGYGFGAEGDWKTAALLRMLKVMAHGLPGGVSFMEDYTLHLEPGRERILGAHMLEVCPSIAAGKPRLEVHPLGIGGKGDPARLVFTTKPGNATNTTLVELADHFRLITCEVEVVKPDAPLSKLPVACTVWVPKCGVAKGAEGWIQAGGAHHSVHAPALTVEYLRDYAQIAGMELIEVK